MEKKSHAIHNYFINITKYLNLKPHTLSNTMDIEQIISASKQLSKL